MEQLHYYHKTTYRKERLEYYRRQQKAIDHPEDYYSDISDGMASNKTKCPHFSDSYNFSNSLDMHIQGQLAHGRSLDLYRSFPNVKTGSNLANHCWLLSLEEEYKLNMKTSGGTKGLPDTIYHQVDGGSENTAKASLALCELLVAKRLVRKVVLSRLPVGHTHEDIDGIFGLIWRTMMNTRVLTPFRYAADILKACFNKERRVGFYDLWCVPDYKAYFEPFVNPNLGRYAWESGRSSRLYLRLWTAVTLDIPTE